MTILIYLLAGALAGLLGGLLGVGGGLVIVPALIFCFQAQHFAPEVLTHMAVGTSLATIIFTSISSVKAHHEHQAVRWELVKGIAPGIVIGTLLGATVAHLLQGRTLQLVIGSFAILMGLQMLSGWKPGGKNIVALPGSRGLFTGGGLIGVASAIFGIGGGSLTVPWLSHHGVRMQEAVATSSACGLAIALSGTAGFILTGLQTAHLPEYSLGYIYLPAFAGISITSVLFARMGAKLAHRLPAATLKKIFAVLLVIVGSQFVFGMH